MPSTQRSEIQKSLVLFSTFELKIKVTLKSKQNAPFIARVADFNYKEEEPRVIFKRCEETAFPTDTEEKQEPTYMVYIKNIRSVEKIMAK